MNSILLASLVLGILGALFGALSRMIHKEDER